MPAGADHGEGGAGGLDPHEAPTRSLHVEFGFGRLPEGYRREDELLVANFKISADRSAGQRVRSRLTTRPEDLPAVVSAKLRGKDGAPYSDTQKIQEVLEGYATLAMETPDMRPALAEKPVVRTDNMGRYPTFEFVLGFTPEASRSAAESFSLVDIEVDATLETNFIPGRPPPAAPALRLVLDANFNKVAIGAIQEMTNGKIPFLMTSKFETVRRLSFEYVFDTADDAAGHIALFLNDTRLSTSMESSPEWRALFNDPLALVRQEIVPQILRKMGLSEASTALLGQLTQLVGGLESIEIALGDKVISLTLRNADVGALMPDPAEMQGEKKQVNDKVLLIGLDDAGKTQLLYKTKLDELVTTIPTIGFNVETIDYGGQHFDVYDVGGNSKIRPLWRHYYDGAATVAFVVDGTASDRFEEARRELHNAMNDLPPAATVVIVINKTDLSNCADDSTVYRALHLGDFSLDRSIKVVRTSVLSGLAPVLSEAQMQSGAAAYAAL